MYRRSYNIAKDNYLKVWTKLKANWFYKILSYPLLFVWFQQQTQISISNFRVPWTSVSTAKILYLRILSSYLSTVAFVYTLDFGTNSISTCVSPVRTTLINVIIWEFIYEYIRERNHLRVRFVTLKRLKSNISKLIW